MSVESNLHKKRGSVYGPNMENATDFAVIFVETHKDKKGKYGRYLVDIYLPDEFGTNVGEVLVNEGLAKIY